ncbi:MAG TPA: cytochrome c [Pyrinomonadaceae bacterium]|nr:cytochrome c [Pyrinomonadaceae bacterium]
MSRKACWSNVNRNVIAGAVVFVALAIWCLKFPAPLGPPVEAMGAEYLPRPGAQFLWLYQLLKYVPGGLGSIIGVGLPTIGLLILLLLPWLARPKTKRLVGGLVLASSSLLIIAMTLAAYVSDRGDQHARKQLARQAAEENVWRQEPFNPKLLQSQQRDPANSSPINGGPPPKYIEYCVNCHGLKGEGAQQGQLKFPPLLNVAAKPRRSVTDIVALLKDPAAYGLKPPMRSFADKLSEAEMKEIADFVVRLK